MAYDLEEQEQLAEIKAWWKQYGRLVIVTVVAGILVVGGIQGWRYYRNSQIAGAAALFEQQQRAERINDQKKLRDIATQIVEHYPSTQFAVLAALAAAKADFDTGELTAAKKRLLWVIENTREDEARDVACLHALRVSADAIDDAEPGAARARIETQDARRARDAGVDGVIVSNHGGRAEASGRGTIEALKDVVDAVGPSFPVWIDGGVRRGTDVFKALALGARAVGIGRPYFCPMTKSSWPWPGAV